MSTDQLGLDEQERQCVLVETQKATATGALCFVCALRDAVDRQVTARWLARARPAGHESLGVACCPVHSWRLWELTAADAARTAERREPHRACAEGLCAAMRRMADALAELESRARRGGWLAGWQERRPPALLWERPHCPLCKVMPADSPALIALVARACEASDATGREAIARSLCPRDRLVSYAAVRRWPEFALPVRRTASAWSGWWELPEPGGSDVSFVRRLIDAPPGREITDDLCPACWVRAEHERLLVHEVRQRSVTDNHAAADVDRNPAVRSLGPLGDDVCARHVALLCAPPTDPSGQPRGVAVLLGGMPVPHQWPVGTLRREPDTKRCLLCAVLHGWDLARMEGLRRAAGSAALYNEVTAALRPALARRTHGFCLPHWVGATASAPSIVTRTLVDLEFRGTATLRQAIEQHARMLGRSEPRDVDAGEAGEACAAAVAGLAGYPV